MCCCAGPWRGSGAVVIRCFFRFRGPAMFNPYHMWLGILPKDQPPHHYRFLGLEPFESDPDVIDSAADRQMSFVRQYQSGIYGLDAAHIPNELASARICLLNRESKQEYDVQLRKQLSVGRIGFARPLWPAMSTATGRRWLIAVAVCAMVCVIVAKITHRTQLAVPVANTSDTSTPSELVALPSQVLADSTLATGNHELNPPEGVEQQALVTVDIAGSATEESEPDVTEDSKQDPTETEEPGTRVAGEVSQADDATKIAVPTTERQVAISRLLDETYGLAKLDTLAKKQRVSALLMEATRNGDLSADEKYVVLITITRLTIETGDFTSFWDAVNAIATSFEGKPQILKERSLRDFLQECKVSGSLKPAIDESLTASQSAALENRFVEANSLLDSAQSAIQRLKVAAKLSSAVADVRKSVAGRQTQWTAFQRAKVKLQADANDPQANLDVGRWHAVHEADWKTALPFLAKSSDIKWKAASELELKSTDESTSLVAVGDMWWDIADRLDVGLARTRLLEHAREWYERAIPNLTSLQKQRITQRLNAIEPVKANIVAPLKENAKPSIDTKQIVDKLPVGEWVDLLPMVKLPDHVLRGTWQREGPTLTSQVSENSQILVPVAIRGSYELRCEFTRRLGTAALVLNCPVGSTSCSVALSAAQGAVSGIDCVDGRLCWDLPASSGAVSRPGKLSNGQRYHLNIEILQARDEAAVVAKLDGQQFIGWKGRERQLTCNSGHVLPTSRILGIVANASAFDLHKLELRLKRGTMAYSLSDDWLNPITAPAASPPKHVEAQCFTWNNRKYLISEKPQKLVEAQILANQLQGRLLTISSADEESFIQKQGGGMVLWMAAWKRNTGNQWRDDRNQPLRYPPKWTPGEPQSTYYELFAVYNTAAGGWWDAAPFFDRAHACIEWGEEYPAAK